MCQWTPADVAGLKLEFQRQLDGARAADLVQRIEATIWASRTETVRQRLCRVAELRTCEIADRRPEIRMVEDVKELASET